MSLCGNYTLFITARNRVVSFLFLYSFVTAAWCVALFSNTVVANTTPTPGTLYTPGPADYCRQFPDYALEQGFGGQVFISTNLKGHKGLVFVGKDALGKPHVYQHESWVSAGNLAAYAYDDAGNIYVAPSPLVSLYENPLGEQNTIWKIDAKTQRMVRFAEVQAAAAASTSNPFGILGMVYDCDTRSLYVTSVMGSTHDVENGRITRVSIDDKSTHVITEYFDGFGLAVLNNKHHKSLYVGSARTSRVARVALDEQGNPTGDLETVFYLSNLRGGGK